MNHPSLSSPESPNSSEASLECEARLNLMAAPYSTYRIGGPMEEAYFPESMEQTAVLIQRLKPRLEKEERLTLIGWGSNSLIASAGISGITIITRKLANIEDLGSNRYRIGAGVHLAKVSTYLLDKGHRGAEFFIGIPGTMGGAVAMNAGAMGAETNSILEAIWVVDLSSGELIHLSQGDLKFDYRYCSLPVDRYLIVAADCKLEPGDLAEAKAKMEANMRFRKDHHPTEPNGGSVFRNPAGGPPVGKMIDELGGKGTWSVGKAQVSQKHGNFIINTGDATSLDVLGLMLKMKRAVAEHYGFTIFPENRFLGSATPEEQAMWAELKEGDPHLVEA